MAAQKKWTRLRTAGRRFADAAWRLNDGKAHRPKGNSDLRTEPQGKGKQYDDHWGGYGPRSEWPPGT